VKSVLARCLAVVLLLASCNQRSPGDRPRNAIVILLDTVRADRLSCYGNARATTPAIDAFAAQSVVFETVVSSSPWTKPSICALLDARQPGHAIDEDGRLERSLVESFRKAGVRTAAFTEGGFFSRYFDMNRGFDHFVEEEGAVQLLEPGEVRNENPRGGIENTFALARAWLAEHKQQPFFVVIHTYEPHMPYLDREFARALSSGRLPATFTLDLLPRVRSGELELTADETEYVKALYDGDLRSTDRHVGAFLAFLGEQGLARNTLVVLTSDHGEELGDHDPDLIGDHGHSLHDALVLVPLIVRDPTATSAPRRIASQVRVIDILPTIAERMRVDVDVPIHGASLVPLIEGRREQNRPALMGWNGKGPASIGIREDGFKYIVHVPGGQRNKVLRHPSPPCQLYDLENDPGERHNLCASRPKLVAALQTTLRQRSAGLEVRQELPDGEAIDERLSDRLRSLGYVD
jgi:arylsulfatase A-like enzyme